MRVFSNTAMSVDGKIATRSGRHVMLGTAEDRRLMSVLRGRADAVLVGGATFRNWPHPLIERPEHRVAEARRPKITAVLTRTGICEALASSTRWPSDDVRLVVFGPRDLAEREALVARGADVVLLDDPSPGAVLGELAARGCRQVLVEGGGALLFQLVRDGLLDEMYVTVTPWIVGGEQTTTLVQGDGFDEGDLRRLSVRSVRRVGDELYLHYDVRPQSGGQPSADHTPS